MSDDVTFYQSLSQVQGNQQKGNTSRIEILPIQGLITTHDGRQFRVPDPVSVISHSKKKGIDILVDYEHDSNKKEGAHRSLAAGWISNLSLTEHAIVADVMWTPVASEKIKNKEFRYLSPSLMHNEENEILSIKSVALTNTPALPLHANLSQKDDNSRLIELTETSMTHNDAIQLLKAELNIADLSDNEVEAALKTASTAITRDVENAIEEYVFPRAIEAELTLLRKELGANDFNAAASKLSNSGLGFTHIKRMQTSSLTRYPQQDDQRSKDEHLACKITGTTKDEFLKAKDNQYE
ncbi:MAG: phage protease [Vibrio sp.]|uniref:phage protease n=1 Tax=Vibrio sp. TaxID=678 RepID=UPI003A89B31A